MGFSDQIFFFFFFFFEIVLSHNQKFLGSKQAPRYTGKRVILMRVLTRLECTSFYVESVLMKIKDNIAMHFAFF